MKQATEMEDSKGRLWATMQLSAERSRVLRVLKTIPEFSDWVAHLTEHPEDFEKFKGLMKTLDVNIDSMVPAAEFRFSVPANDESFAQKARKLAASTRQGQTQLKVSGKATKTSFEIDFELDGDNFHLTFRASPKVPDLVQIKAEIMDPKFHRAGDIVIVAHETETCDQVAKLTLRKMHNGLEGVGEFVLSWKVLQAGEIAVSK